METKRGYVATLEELAAAWPDKRTRAQAIGDCDKLARRQADLHLEIHRLITSSADVAADDRWITLVRGLRTALDADKKAGRS